MVVVNLKDKDELHFPFCQDLGQKKFFSLEKVLGEGQDKQMNLTWSLFRVKQTYGIFGGGSVKLPNSDIYLPGNYQIEKVNGAEYNFFDREKSYNVFVAPSDYPNRGRLFYEGKRKLEFQLPQEFKEQPHLFPHSTFQFSFLRNILFSTNLQFLDIDENNVIQATTNIYASPTGTYFVFKSGEIPFKWKIEIRQNVIVMDLTKDTIEAIQKTGRKIGAALAKGFSLGTINLDGTEMDAVEGLIGGMTGGKDNWNKMGLDKERIQRIQEQQTERLFKSTYTDMIDKTIEPSIFYSNSVQFPYNLFDFFLRSFTPHWETRVHISKTLYNNLIHNNNENPITYPLNITFEKLGNILRPGYWQGKLTLDYDPNGRMAECFARGVTFYDNKDKSEFPNPKLGIAGVVSSQLKIGHGAEFYTAQTITEPGEGITVNIPYTADQRGYSHSTYIRLTNSSVMDDFKNALVASCGCNSGNLHYDSSNGFCWGCTYDELVRVNFASFKFTPSSNCSVLLKLDVSSSEIKDLDLKAEVEYTVTITSSQFVFKAQDKTRIIIQKVPQSDDFNNLDWTPPGTGGGDIEIPLTDPGMPEPDPNDPDREPEPDFPAPDIDPGGGEPEITIEPDITPDTNPDIPVEPDVPEPDIPEPDITPDTDPDKPTDPDPSGDPDPNDPEPEKPEDFD